jgi:hypothetical protein
MTRMNRWMLITVLAFTVPLAACGNQQTAEAGHEPPAEVTHDGDDAGVTRIRLTEKAAERLGVQTAPVEPAGSSLTAVPYGAIFYGTGGETWLYVSPEPLTFVREPIVVDRIEGDNAIMSESPPVGTEVATVGVAELFGTETGIDGSGH